jgi:hypothetical protein
VSRKEKRKVGPLLPWPLLDFRLSRSAKDGRKPPQQAEPMPPIPEGTGNGL